jgi:hypothetical protein
MVRSPWGISSLLGCDDEEKPGQMALTASRWVTGSDCEDECIDLEEDLDVFT